MKKKVKRGIVTAVLPVVALVTYLLWPGSSVETPRSARTLDLSETQNAELYLAEEELSDQMTEVVQPYLEAHRTQGYMAGYDGRQLYWEQYTAEEPKAHIAIAHGYTDASYKFREIIYYFLKSGYSVSILDHRGHGYSYRSDADLSKVTVASFDEYVEDYTVFVDTIVRPSLAEDEKLFIYAHSMGGAIAALLLERDSLMFDAAVLSSPMMEIQFDGIPENLAKLIVGTANLVGLGESYILGNGAYEDIYNYADSSYNSEARYAYLHDIQRTDEYFQTNGGSFRWLKAAIAATDEIEQNAASFTTNALLFQAACDTTVGADGQNAFVNKAQNVQMIIVPDTKHNILFAGNDVLVPYMNAILAFYEENL
ncbi:MAG: alpha/beta hydrolase [Roseburia sp.]|nr:alpha/beta hydrolase [Roseburia sp.]